MNTQLTNLVEQTVLDKMRAQEAFTALDISNALKADRHPIRHGDVAVTVRDIHQAGAMLHYDYHRLLIDVVTENGTKKARAFLYLHGETRQSDYRRRDQSALPHVPADQARDLSASVAAGPVPILPRPAPSRAASGRRDGALAVPRALVQSLGWSAGMMLILTNEGGRMRLVVHPPAPQERQATVRVWDGCRLRVCKTKLRIGALTAEVIRLEVSAEGDLELRAD